MGWFTKTEEKNKTGLSIPEFPRLPELPEMPRLEEFEEQEKLPQLPSFPSNRFGEKFSQNAIKEAVTGRKEVSEEEANEFEEERMMPKPPKDMPMVRDIEEVPRGFRDAARLVRNVEPVFIRIDKFEQSLEVFGKAKKKIMDIEKMLNDVKRLKDKETEELNNWEKEIQTTKEQIERVDKELFSKIE